MNDILSVSRAACFAAEVHGEQKRKGRKGEPYVNHLAEVALLVAEATGGDDVNLIVAAWLHDTVEDQPVTPEQIAARFGEDVVRLVMEVTDDKNLPKQTRKQLQVETTASKSRRARILKLADKTSNVKALVRSPPADWPPEHLRDYVRWAETVVDRGCRGLNAELEAGFDAAAREARAAFAFD